MPQPTHDHCIAIGGSGFVGLAGVTVADKDTWSFGVMAAYDVPPCVGTDTTMLTCGDGTNTRVTITGALVVDRAPLDTTTLNANWASSELTKKACGTMSWGDDDAGVGYDGHDTGDDELDAAETHDHE